MVECHGIVTMRIIPGQFQQHAGRIIFAVGVTLSSVIRWFLRRPLLIFPIAAFVFCLLAGHLLAGLTPGKISYATRYWLRENGLPQNTVTAVVQTRDGYIWIGTYFGLARFDGVRFTKFESGNTPGLASSRVTSLFEDDRGVLWIGHEAGELTCYQAGKFTPFPLKVGWQQRRILHITADASGDVWLQNSVGELARVRDGLLVTPESGDWSGVMEMTRNAQGRIWVVRSGRVSELQNGRAVPLTFGGELATTNPVVLAICASRDGGLWLDIDGEIKKWKDGHFQKNFGPTPLGGAPMLTLIETRDGTLVGATSDHGFAFISQDGTVTTFDRSTGFSSDWIESLCEDREGGLWVGTGGAGLALVRQTCLQTLAPPDHWQGRAVLSVCGSRTGGLWVGTEGAGVYRYQNGNWTNYGFSSGLDNPYVWSVAEDSAGNFWAGTWSSGLLVRRGERFAFAPGLTASVTPVTALLPARTGGLWAGTALGLLHYDGVGKVTWCSPSGLPTSNDVRCILEARDDSLWFGTDGQGLFHWRNGVLDSFRQTDGLPSNFILCLREDESGAVWIGTYGGGLCRFKAGRFVTINEQQGLPDNVICDIEEDEQAYYWMSSYNGLIRVSRAALNACADGTSSSLSCIDYGMSDGMPTLECSGGMQPAGCRTADGRLWFTTSRGLVVVNPQAVKKNSLPPPVLIETLLVDGIPANLAASPLRIPPGRHRLEFQYAGLSFAAPEKVRFKHKLDGIDPDWIEAGTRRAAEYNYMPPGGYTFHVIACNNDGVWNEAGADFQFTMLPAFWQTVWFRTLMLAGIILLAGGGAWFATRHRMRVKLDDLEHQRTIERERTRIARDIHDDLGASLTRINLMSQSARRGINNVSQTTENLEQICTTARQLTRAMDEIVWAVDPQHDTLDSLATYLGKLIHELLANSEIRCRLDFPVQLPTWSLTAEVRHNFFLACKEALHNVIKHSGASEVQISFVLEPAGFALKIADNGGGFDSTRPNGQVLVGRQPNLQRNGLVNMRQRMQEIGGRCEIRSNPENGTQVIFSLPVTEVMK
jgi:signal transduction histidine kinase/ligand-binding sensor domain-containing protein